MVSDETFRAALQGNAERIEDELARLLGDGARVGEHARPFRLLAAMRHGSLGGGKRVRPFLVVQSADLCLPGQLGRAALEVGAALELVHCYSLVHDDLPSMDDDDVRRGRPTVHVAYDEATAILAGDALLTLAFDAIADATDLEAERRIELCRMLARAAGVGGMAGGQMLDLEAGRTPPDVEGIERLQAMKTGALIRFGCEAGAVVVGASERERAALRKFGELVGLAFQIADDLLDITQTAEAMGKATGKDAGQGKGTLVAHRGEAWARRRLDELVEAADDLLAPFGDRAGLLRRTARYVAQRER